MSDILCYGDSNTWGCIPLQGPEPARRFPPETRWPGVLRRELGDGHWIVEEGLSGRTTVWDDPLEPHRNGRKLLLPTLLTHQPLDLVIVMLGTNDLKHRLNASAAEIADGRRDARRHRRRAAAAARTVARRRPCSSALRPSPRSTSSPMSSREGRRSPAGWRGHFAAVAEQRSCAFLDAGAVISSSDVDGIHLDEPQHAALGAAIAEQVRPLLA